MKITALYVYPIKSLRGIPLESAELGPQGVLYDRRFMLYEVTDSGDMKKIQLSSHTNAALFGQEIRGDSIIVKYYPPPASAGDKKVSAEHLELQSQELEVPLEPEFENLEPLQISLHGSPTHAYRMRDHYNAWFSACFGHRTQLIFLGDGQRPVLGTLSPTAVTPKPKPPAEGGWFSSLASYIPGRGAEEEESDAQWISFSDCAPLLITSESSLHDVTARLPEGDTMDMYKFRPNIVVDGEGETAWAEDFWAELALSSPNAATNGHAANGHTGGKTAPRLLLTSNCGRCTSLNVDYQTGKPAAGEKGTVLKKLMKDRRVDTGNKYSPVFGRYAFLPTGIDSIHVTVGSQVEVTKRNTERTVWDWPGL